MKKKLLLALYILAAAACFCYSFPILLFTLRPAPFFIGAYLLILLGLALVKWIGKREWAGNALLGALAIPILVLAAELTAMEIGWLPFPG